MLQVDWLDRQSSSTELLELSGRAVGLDKPPYEPKPCEGNDMFKKIASIAAGLLVALGAVSAATPAVAADLGPVPQSVKSVNVSTSALIWDW